MLTNKIDTVNKHGIVSNNTFAKKAPFSLLSNKNDTVNISAVYANNSTSVERENIFTLTNKSNTIKKYCLF